MFNILSFQSRKTLDFESLNICISGNRMLSFFDENGLGKRDLNERGNAGGGSEDVESEGVKYAFCFDCLNF